MKRRNFSHGEKWIEETLTTTTSTVLEDDDVTVSLTGRASWPSDSRRHGGGSQTKGDSGDVSPSNTRHIRFHPKQERMNCVMFLEQNKNSYNTNDAKPPNMKLQHRVNVTFWKTNEKQFFFLQT
ncbi:hypothetical protein F2P81_019621 [Scophthalmus maximus]|uniref:Uncharacterized protein n=1 Tax=Scophthalmus maximus TaxID=52904 RepID=A0A6A4SCB8_SCOMX|nr:hypothetical protein F2P81_019621 [Scophthalmus maximus]